MSRLIYKLPESRKLLIRGCGLLSHLAPLSIPATNFHPASYLTLAAPIITTVYFPRFIFQLDRNVPLGTITIEHPLKVLPYLTKTSTFGARTIKFPPRYDHWHSFTLRLSDGKPQKFFWFRHLVPEQAYHYCMGSLRGTDYQNVAYQILKYQMDKLNSRKLPDKEHKAEAKKIIEDLERNASKLTDKKFRRQMMQK